MAQHDDWERQYLGFRNGPFSWAFRADLLLHAASVLHDRYDAALRKAMADPETYFAQAGPQPWADVALLQMVYYLQAMAIENLLKSLIVGRDPGALETTHELAELSRAAGLTLPEDDIALLGELTAVIKWNARYQVPRRLADYVPRKGAYEFATTPGMLGPDKREHVGRIIDALQSEYRARHK